jgi:hypothetical protein
METSRPDRRAVLAPNSPSRGTQVAFVMVNGAPVELVQFDRSLRRGC